MNIFTKLPNELNLSILNYLLSKMNYSLFRVLPNEIIQLIYDFNVTNDMLLIYSTETDNFDYVHKYISQYLSQVFHLQNFQ